MGSKWIEAICRGVVLFWGVWVRDDDEDTGSGFSVIRLGECEEGRGESFRVFSRSFLYERNGEKLSVGVTAC